MDAFIFRSSRERVTVDYDPTTSLHRFKGVKRPMTEREKRYVENWERASRPRRNKGTVGGGERH